mgnify:FL=1
MTWNLARGEDFLPRTSLSELKLLMKAETKAKPRLRLLIAAHRKQGKPLDGIAEACGVARRTVHGTLERFQKHGVTAAYAVKQEGRPPRLTVKQRKLLVHELERGPAYNHFGLWTTRQVRELIRKKFGINYAPQHVWRILINCGFSLQRPRKRHHKAALPEEMERFKKKRAGKHAITEKKGLSWAHRMRPPSVSSQTLREGGLKKDAEPRR